VRYGMTVNSLTSVALEPVLVLFCCQRDATLHAPLLRSGEWAVSVLGAMQDDLSRAFATRGQPGVDRFTGQACRPGPSTGAPLVDGAIAWLECRTWATYDGGDHTIVLGEVIGLEPGERDDALVYFRRGYGTVLQT